MRTLKAFSEAPTEITYVDLTEEDCDTDIIQPSKTSKLASDNVALQKKVLDLERKNNMLEMELVDVRQELKDTRETLGAVVVSNRQQSRDFFSLCFLTSMQRARSPSLEMMKEPMSSKARGKMKEEAPVTPKHTQLYDNKSSEHSFSDVKVEATPDISLGKRKRESTLSTPLKRIKPESLKNLLNTPQIKDNHAGSSPRIKRQKTELKLEKPDIKMKDVFNLPPNVTKIYLGETPTLKVDPPPVYVEISRDFLRVCYGGSNQQFLQYIQPERNPSGNFKRRIVFPMLDMNPAMPAAPGEPGLVFASRHEILEDGPWTLFVKRNPKIAIWLYLGEYICELCGKMTAEQFRAQSSKVQTEWAEFLLKMKLFEVYVSMRARIALRKAGILPIDDKEAEEILVAAEVVAVKNKKPLYEVNAKDIVKAFRRGDEGVDIIRMTCVKYDHVFVKDIQQRHEDAQEKPVSSLNGTTETKSKKTQTKRTATRSLTRHPKRRTPIIELDSEEDLPDNYQGDESDGEFLGCVIYTTNAEDSSSSRTLRPRRTTRASAWIEPEED
ncbi:hypothetical protein CPB83DRAFT_908867 [Crepidotus variabilis]|uniref:DUF6697 domain-containing protein n=1 Tax=Crepidotus variabilis TaxID=179855 RepID=A0A9P6JMQ6_9AGAR|nr:hypothetical protein CPB83DRAFT_908867 [Crepidotus variabilis]